MKRLQFDNSRGPYGQLCIGLGRFGVGYFRGYAGKGLLAIGRGWTSYQLRIWRLAIAWKMPELHCVSWLVLGKRWTIGEL